jgi:hypothetical protein
LAKSPVAGSEGFFDRLPKSPVSGSEDIFGAPPKSEVDAPREEAAKKLKLLGVEYFGAEVDVMLIPGVAGMESEDVGFLRSDSPSPH